MASKRFITKAQAAYVARQNDIRFAKSALGRAERFGDVDRISAYHEIITQLTDDAERIFHWIELALSGESNRHCEQISGYSPARRDVGRSTAAMVQEVAR